MREWKPKLNSRPLTLKPCEYLHQGQQHPLQRTGVSPSLTWEWLGLPRPGSCPGCSLSVLVDHCDQLIMVPARSMQSPAGPHCQEFSKDKQSVSFRDVKLARHHFSSESQAGRKCQKHIPCASVLYVPQWTQRSKSQCFNNTRKISHLERWQVHGHNPKALIHQLNKRTTFRMFQDNYIHWIAS